MGTYSERIADFAANLSFNAIPPEVIERAKLHILDSLGVAFTSLSDMFSRSLVDAFGKLKSNPESTLLGAGEKMSREYAACANGALIHGNDFDDTHLPGATHPGSCIIPTALALGEAEKIRGKDFLEAVVLGYEVMTRIGMASNGQFQDRGFHVTPLCGVFASCLTAAKIERLTAGQMVNAMGICGSQASGIQQFLADGTWTKKLHPGWAVHSGILSALMASSGFTGPGEVFEGKAGVFSTHVNISKCKLNLLTESLGSEWETLRTSIKLYPSCQFTHSFINCALYLKNRHSIQWKDIERIKCRISPRGARWTCDPIEKKRKASSSYEARFSLPFTIAMALVKGKVGLEQFNDHYIRDEKIRLCAGKVEYVTDEHLSKEVEEFSGDVLIELKNGAKYRHQQKYELSYSNACLDREAVKSKFKANMEMSGFRDRQRAEEIIAAIEKIEKMENIEELSCSLY